MMIRNQYYNAAILNIYDSKILYSPNPNIKAVNLLTDKQREKLIVTRNIY